MRVYVFLLMTSWLSLTVIVGGCSSVKKNPGASMLTNVSSVQKKDVTVTEGTNMAAAISSDGAWIVMDLQGTLWRLPSEGGQALAITDAKMDARLPHWSPDGSMIAFQGYWEGNWHIYIVDPSGGQLKQLTEGRFDHREPFWAPDGRTIACSSDRSGSYDIWSIDVERKTLLQLTETSDEVYSPSYDSDGSHLLYARKEGRETFIETLDLSSQQVSQLYSDEADISGLQYTPDGNHLIYTSFSEGRSSLMTYDLEADRVTPYEISDRGEDVFPFKVSWVDETSFIYTSSGKIKKGSLAKSVMGEVSFEATFSIDLATRNYPRKKRDFDDRSPHAVKGIYQPQISPDGRAVAFIALCDLWVKLDDRPALQITNDASIQLAPAWSSDGGKIAYVTDHGGTSAIWVHDVSVGTSKRLGVTQGLAAGLDWTSTDEQIIYTLNYGPRLGMLWKMEVSTGLSERIGRPFAYSLSGPSISSDDETIAVSVLSPYSGAYREGINRIILASMDGTESWSPGAARHASFGMRGNDGPQWSPDGRYMTYISQGFLWLTPIDEQGRFSGATVQITDELTDNASWTSDGGHLCYQTPSSLKKINIETREITTIEIDLDTRPVIEERKICIHAGWIFTGRENYFLRDQDIVIINNRIRAIEDHDPGRKVDQWIDASKQYVMPGLIDIHAHQESLSGSSLGYKWLSWGVTSTRDPATNPYDALNRREATRAGKIIGPRIFFTGSPLDGNRVYYGGTFVLEDKTQLEMELGRARSLEYDFIKTYVRLRDPWQEEVVRRGHEMGLPVYSHELYPAASYGVDGVEHILGTSRRGYSPKMTATYRAYSDVAELIATSGMSFTPTIGIYVGYDYLLSGDTTVIDDIRLMTFESPRFHQSVSAAVEKVAADPELWSKNFTNAGRVIKEVHDRGGLVVAGTDGPILPFGFGLHIELECYQKAGLTPYEVLRTATVNGAKVLGAEEDLGTVDVGKLADLLILNSDPLEDVKHLRDIDKIIYDGRIITAQSLIRRWIDQTSQ